MLLYSVRKGVNSAFWNAEELCLASSECVVGPVLASCNQATGVLVFAAAAGFTAAAPVLVNFFDALG